MSSTKLHKKIQIIAEGKMAALPQAAAAIGKEVTFISLYY
jgi:hypothetical protein